MLLEFQLDLWSLNSTDFNSTRSSRRFFWKVKVQGRLSSGAEKALTFKPHAGYRLDACQLLIKTVGIKQHAKVCWLQLLAICIASDGDSLLTNSPSQLCTTVRRWPPSPPLRNVRSLSFADTVHRPEPARSKKEIDHLQQRDLEAFGRNDEKEEQQEFEGRCSSCFACAVLCKTYTATKISAETTMKIDGPGAFQ